MTLFKLWKDQEEKAGLKVRWADWNWQHKFFVIKSVDLNKKVFSGNLDCGESISYPFDSPHWSVYQDGDEHSPKAS